MRVRFKTSVDFGKPISSQSNQFSMTSHILRRLTKIICIRKEFISKQFISVSKVPKFVIAINSTWSSIVIRKICEKIGMDFFSSSHEYKHVFLFKGLFKINNHCWIRIQFKSLFLMPTADHSETRKQSRIKWLRY